VCWRHVAKGVLRLVESWTTKLEFSKIEIHKLHTRIGELNLERIGVDEEDVTKAVTRLRTALANSEKATRPPSKKKANEAKAELTRLLEGEFDAGSGAAQALAGRQNQATKGVAKGAAVNKGSEAVNHSECFKCGSTEHWAKECPQKEAVCRMFAKTGKCSYGDSCKFQHSDQKRANAAHDDGGDDPEGPQANKAGKGFAKGLAKGTAKNKGSNAKRKARVMQLVDALFGEVDDKGGDSSGNESSHTNA
jgi:hypothetical protein